MKINQSHVQGFLYGVMTTCVLLWVLNRYVPIGG